MEMVTLNGSRPTKATVLASTIVVLSSLLFLCIVVEAFICPRYECGPIISKCQLIEACRCEARTNMTCFKHCSHCLEDHYAECCQCVGICPADNETDTINDYHIGQIKLTDTTSELFELVTADSELGEAWTVQTEPVVAHNSQQLQKQSTQTDIQTTSIASISPLSTELSNTTILAQPETIIPHEEPSNCTMAYLSYCVDIYKCEAACTALGASTYKWFHIGCCLCLGKPCYNLAGNVARCRNCPEEPYQTIDLENVDGGI